MGLCDEQEGICISEARSGNTEAAGVGVLLFQSALSCLPVSPSCGSNQRSSIEPTAPPLDAQVLALLI